MVDRGTLIRSWDGCGFPSLGRRYALICGLRAQRGYSEDRNIVRLRSLEKHSNYIAGRNNRRRRFTGWSWTSYECFRKSFEADGWCLILNVSATWVPESIGGPSSRQVSAASGASDDRRRWVVRNYFAETWRIEWYGRLSMLTHYGR